MANAVSSHFEIYQPVPDAEVVVMKDGKRLITKMSEVVEPERSVIVFVPGAFTKVCGEQHLPSFCTKEWKESAYKVYCVSTDTINVLEEWKKKLKNADHIRMVSNVHQNLWPDSIINHPELGCVQVRTVAVIHDGKINKILSEDNIECVVTHGNALLWLLQGAQRCINENGKVA